MRQFQSFSKRIAGSVATTQTAIALAVPRRSAGGVLNQNFREIRCEQCQNCHDPEGLQRDRRTKLRPRFRHANQDHPREQQVVEQPARFPESRRVRKPLSDDPPGDTLVRLASEGPAALPASADPARDDPGRSFLSMPRLPGAARPLTEVFAGGWPTARLCTLRSKVLHVNHFSHAHEHWSTFPRRHLHKPGPLRAAGSAVY